MKAGQWLSPPRRRGLIGRFAIVAAAFQAFVHPGVDALWGQLPGLDLQPTAPHPLHLNMGL